MGVRSYTLAPLAKMLSKPKFIYSLNLWKIPIASSITISHKMWNVPQKENPVLETRLHTTRLIIACHKWECIILLFCSVLFNTWELMYVCLKELIFLNN